MYETEALKRDFNAHNKQIGELKKVLPSIYYDLSTKLLMCVAILV